MHEWAERAVSAARRLGDAAADRGGARRARARGVDDGSARARRELIARRRRRSSIRCRTTSSPVTSTPRRCSPASSSTSTGTPKATRTPPCTGRWRARPARESSSSSSSRRWAAVWRLRGKLAEAAELLDGGIEAARLLGNTHALVWSLSSRSSAALRVGDVELALAAAQESVDLSQEPGEGFHSAEAAADLAAALLETGDPHRAVELLLGSAGGEELSLIAGSPRARYLEVLARCWLALGPPAEANVQPPRPKPGPRPCSCRWRPSGPIERRRPSTSTPATPSRAAERALASAAAADEVGAPVEAALSRTLAGRALAAGRRAATAQPPSSSTRPRVRGARRAALPRRGRARAAEARPPHPPPHTSGQARRDRARIADRARAPGRAARRRPQDEPGDRRRAVPQPEDGRDAPAQHLPQDRTCSSRVELARAVERADRES